MYKPSLWLLSFAALTGCVGGTSTNNQSSNSSSSNQSSIKQSSSLSTAISSASEDAISSVTMSSSSVSLVSSSSVALSSFSSSSSNLSEFSSAIAEASSSLASSSQAISSETSSSSLSSSSSLISSSSVASSSSAVSEPVLSSEKNILGSDGTFSLGQQNFASYFNDAAIPSAISWNNEVAVTLDTLSTEVWHAQIQHAVKVEANKIYTVCFDAVADAERTIEFSIDGDENSEYAILNAVAVGAEPAPVVSTVTTEKQQLQYTFNATTTDATARLILSVGKSDTNIRFDNIGMYAGESCGDPSNLPKKADAVIPTDLTRADCPAPPPAVIGKTPPASRNLTLSNNQLNSLFKPQTPFAASNWTLPWNLYTPSEAANNTTGEKFPLIVVLHGGYGSEGADGNVTRDVLRYAVGVQNTGLLLEPSVSNFPAYVVAPHCKMPQAGAVMVDGKTINQPACAFRTNEWASAGGAGFNVQAEPSLAGGAVIELVEHIIDTYDIDPSRIYVTGNSMGGGGTWEVIIRRPDLFAAAVPVSGHTPASRFFENIAKSKMPIWAFAGSNDFVNPVTDTRNAITQIADQNGCAWLTEYTNTGHDDVLWASPYQESELWSWLFAQQLPAKTQEDDTQNNDSSNSSAPASSVEKIGADYEAPKTNTKPTIDGQIESAWDIAPWDAIDVPWLFDDLVPPSSPQDFSGRYKAMWDADKLYVLVEITDDVIRDLQADPVRLYWQDDTVEIFLDENRSGGSHLQGRNNDVNDANAFAYHLSTLGDTVDTYKTERRVFGDEHIQFKRVSVTPTKSVWELAITIWGEDYTFEAKQNPVILTAGKVMGFTLSYIDNDGNNGTKRESFIGSVDTPGHQNNRGFVTADDFGTLQLVD